ncbi:hypothetical protein FACS1894219_04800 [Clostridia bacterium]|nr:hypothetical protein FACS1894219_04800 [Clostridia bacterium]
MTKIINKIHLPIPEQIAAFVESVCRKQKQLNKAVRPMNMVIPIDSQNGRSRMTRIIADYYHEMKACKFSSRDYYLDLTIDGKISSVCEAEITLIENAEYSDTNYFRGVVAFDIDAILPHINDSVGIKFFELAAEIKKHSVIIFFVPVNSPPKQIEMIAEKIGANLKVLPSIEYDDEFFARFLYEHLRSASYFVPVLDECKDKIVSYIRQNIRTKTIKNIKEAANALLFDDEVLEAIFGKHPQIKEDMVR